MENLQKKFVEYDFNMVSFKELSYDNIKFYDIRKSPFEVYGFYDYKNEDYFKRLPDSVAKSISDGVDKCRMESAGGRIRFSTNSKYIVLKAEFDLVGSNSRTPQLGIAGFDLYLDTENESRYYRPFIPPYDVKDGFETYIDFPTIETRNITINFPYHTCVRNVYIGIEKSADIEKGMRYKNDKPVIFYGSSITHGSCASRPGMIYENILSRRLNMNYINLGFGGSARGEIAIAEYMADLPMSVFVSDYDYNAGSVSYLEDTHKRLYEIIRKRNPDVPYIMLSKPDFAYRESDAIARRRVIQNTFNYAVNNEDKNVYFIDGESIFRGRNWDDCFVDTIHPNDFGFIKYADALEPILSKVL